MSSEVVNQNSDGKEDGVNLGVPIRHLHRMLIIFQLRILLVQSQPLWQEVSHTVPPGVEHPIPNTHTHGE